MRRWWARVGAAACVIATLALAPSGQEAPTRYRQARRLMGTFCEIQVYATDEPRANAAMTRALDEMQRVDRLLSNYDPASELSAMNREASHGPFRVSDELFAFVKRCRDYVELSDGAFDPTVGPLVRAWGFMTPHPAPPPEGDLAAARSRSGFDKVQLDDAARTVRFTVPGVEIDPGGIGKGYAVDRAARVLEEAGVSAALVSAGDSTLYGIGHPPDRAGWRVAVKAPWDPSTPMALVELRDASISTSGVTERFVRVGTHLYPHIFDPRTKEPVEGMCQASVVAPTATDSDALSKAAFILSRDDVVRMFRQRAGLHALRAEGACGPASRVWTTPWSAPVFRPWPNARTPVTDERR